MRPITPTMMVKTATNSAADRTSSPSYASSIRRLAVRVRFLIFCGCTERPRHVFGCLGVTRNFLRTQALRLRFLRTLRLARPVEGDGMANERLESGLVDLLSFANVDRAANVSVETRVEETGRILQRRALRERQLHDGLVGFAGADDALVRPDRRAHPLPLFDDVRVGSLDQRAHSTESLAAPVAEVGDSFRDQLRCRPFLACARFLHGLILAIRRSPASAARGAIRRRTSPRAPQSPRPSPTPPVHPPLRCARSARRRA